MSYQLVDEVFDLDAPPMAKILLMALCRHADEEGRSCYPGFELLSSETGMPESTARRWMKRLVEMGFVSVRKRSRQSNLYTILLDRSPVSAHKNDHLTAHPRALKRRIARPLTSERSEKLVRSDRAVLSAHQRAPNKSIEQVIQKKRIKKSATEPKKLIKRSKKIVRTRPPTRAHAGAWAPGPGRDARLELLRSTEKSLVSLAKPSLFDEKQKKRIRRVEVPTSAPKKKLVKKSVVKKSTRDASLRQEIEHDTERMMHLLDERGSMKPSSAARRLGISVERVQRVIEDDADRPGTSHIFIVHPNKEVGTL